MAISSDGRKLFVTAANGYIYVINIDGQDRPTAPNQNERKWHEQIGAVLTNNGADGVAATADPLKLTFTNGQQNSDAKGFGVVEVTNDDPLNFAASARYIDLSLGNAGDYFDVNEGVAVTVMPDGRYAFVAGRNRQGSVWQTDKRAGGNIGIIKDPLTNPQLVAATRPIPQALTADLVLSNDSKYLYASYPNLNGTGSTYVFDVEEIIETLENPGNFLIDGLDRGEGSPFFDAGSAKSATWGDLSRVPVDDINPEISVAADYGIVQGNWASYQFTYGVLPNSTRGPVALAGGSWGLSAAPADWLSLNGPIGISENSSNPLTPTFKWDFEDILPEDVEEVNLFVSVFDEGNGLLPWDELVDLSGPDGNEFLSKQGLDRQEQLNLLTELWNVSFYGKEDDFNPNRILTATWQRDEDGIGKWTWDGGKTWTEGTNTSFTLPNNRTLTAGQTYYWAVEAWNKEGKQNIDFGEFNTPLPPALNGENTFRSVTVLTHGFKPPFFSQPGIPQEFYEMADNIANAGGNNDGLILRYHRPTGYWVPVNKYGQVPGDLPSGLNPETDPEYLNNLRAYITPYFRDNKPLVLLNNWSQDRESAVPDSGFTEAAADAFFASLVQLDGLLKSEGSVANQGALFNSPLHFIGFSRGTVVNSEIIQRLGTYFPEAGGKENSGIRDLQMTTLDPHDFDQPGLNVITQNFGDFREPKVQVWENVTLADNYYQIVPNLMGGTVTPAGRDIPNLPPTEAGKTAPGLQLPRQGWRSENPNPTAPLLGEPDLSVFLGTNQENSLEYINSRAGFTRETDPGMGIGGKGATHGRVQTWYAGTTDLFPTVFPFPEEADSQNIYRRRGDGYYEELFDKEFSFGDTVSQPPRVSPWYTPEHKQAGFQHGAENAPWEGIGTGWFYSALGGGKDLRPKTFVPRIPVDFDNTYDSRMRGDYPVPTLFNGNFDAVFNPQGQNRTFWSEAIPGWSFHNGSPSTILSTNNLVDWRDIPSLNEPSRRRIRPSVSRDPVPARELTYLEQVDIDPNDRTRANYALIMGGTDGLREIVHNRFVVPDWGALRFNLHVPNPNGGRLQVSMRGSEPNAHWQTLTTIISRVNDTVLRRDSVELVAGNYDDPHPAAHDPNQIGFATRGFETFQFDVPDNLRGQMATLRFQLEGDSTIYLDDVFFKSVHLKLGNPTLTEPLDGANQQEARFDPINQPNNYLIERPQYALSYNNRERGPNWVSYQLNNSWIGEEDRADQEAWDRDPQLLPPLQGTDGDWYTNTNGQIHRGHMTTRSHRDREFKDQQATFYTTDMLPQHAANNSDNFQSAWYNLEGYARDQLVLTENRELYIISGGIGSQAWPNNPPIAPDHPLIQNGINYPQSTWKAIAVLEPGQSVADITDNTRLIGVITPNVARPEELTPEQLAAWRNWANWRVSIDEIERQTGLDLFSNIPVEIQDRLESRVDDGPTDRTGVIP
jgi:DNA/RNA endonuclease G (NUC1)